jgi:lipopolysaccharide/colanic/teichoic acid biosynthesis glycosyltransferase
MYFIAKRIFDVTFSIAILLLLSPVLLLVILLLSITAEREIFYLQDRVGYKNRTFKIIKFATMLKNSPNMGTGSITVRRDPRVTTIGRLLRITKMNELPQLFNVLRGDMSFVGPRPLMPVDFNAYHEFYKRKIYNSAPGITGIGSVVFRDEQKLITESELPPQQFYRECILPSKGALELWYQENKSTQTDLLILFLTGMVLLFPKSNITGKVFPNLPSLKQNSSSNKSSSFASSMRISSTG